MSRATVPNRLSGCAGSTRATSTAGHGTFDTYNGRTTFGKAFPSGFEFLVSGSYFVSQGDDARFYADLHFRRQLTDNLELLAGATYDRFESEATLPFPDTLMRDERLGQWHGAEVQFNRAVGFYNRIKDVIAFDFQPEASRYRNFDGAETLGLSR